MDLKSVLVFAGLSFVSQIAVAGGWNCDAVEQPTPVDKATLSKTYEILKQGTTEQSVLELEKFLLTTSGDSRAYVYQAVAVAQLGLRRVDAAIAAYREILELDTASVNSRGQARDLLAELLAEQGKPRDVIALYERADRSVCGELSPGATYALSLAYNAIGNDAQARQVFEANQSQWPSMQENKPLWRKWRLLGLRLDCVQKNWPQCAASFEEFVRMNAREESVTRQLNAFLAKFRTIPELTDAIDRLQQQGLITEQGVPSAELGLLKEQAEPSVPLRLDPTQDIAKCGAQIEGASEMPDLTGKVVLRLQVDERGNVQDTQVLESDPPGVFDRTTIEAAKRCKFIPRFVGGKPVPSSGVNTWTFKVRTSKTTE